MSECMTQEDAMNMSAEQAIQILKPMQMMMRDQHGCPISDAYFALGKALEALGKEPKWIPFNTRPLTDEEKEEHPEWDCILACKLPDDGQAILVSINVRGHERVQHDEFFTDDGSYLDSGYEIGTEAVAWLPFNRPEPYKGEEDA